MRLVRRQPDVDLVVAALEIARDGQPDLEFEAPLRRLRKAVAELTRPIAMAGDEVSELRLGRDKVCHQRRNPNAQIDHIATLQFC